MPDILYDAAIAYSQIVKYDYHYILGDGNRKKIFSIITNEKDMFSHVCGLDHLKDIPKVTTNKSYMKEKIFKDILDKKITFLDIASSIHLYEKMSSKINPNTHSFYNIYDRIVHLCDSHYHFCFTQPIITLILFVLFGVFLAVISIVFTL